LKITAFNVRPTAGQAPAPFLERHFPFVLILPSVVGTLTLIIFPLLYSLYLSLTSFHQSLPTNANFTWGNSFVKIEVHITKITYPLMITINTVWHSVTFIRDFK